MKPGADRNFTPYSGIKRSCPRRNFLQCGDLVIEDLHLPAKVFAAVVGRRKPCPASAVCRSVDLSGPGILWFGGTLIDFPCRRTTSKPTFPCRQVDRPCYLGIPFWSITVLFRFTPEFLPVSLSRESCRDQLQRRFGTRS